MSSLEYKINNIVKYYYQALLNLPNVEGVGLGLKVINGYTTTEPCVHVLVSKKIPSSYLGTSFTIPKTYMGLKTDVVNVGGKFRFYSLKEKIRPLKSGYSIGPTNADITGTLGCIVFRRSLAKKTYYILSNNHVFADNNRLSVGTNIIQPALSDGGKIQNDVVGTLSEFITLKPTSKIHSPVNYVDVAIGKINSPNLKDNKIAYLGAIKGIAAPKLNTTVKKIGRTTGLTSGIIQTINSTITIKESKSNFLFKNQIIVNIQQDYGDSGSLLVNNDTKVVGLFMGGTTNYSGIFNDFSDVLKFTKTQLYV